MEWAGRAWPDTSVNEGLYHHHSSPQSQARGVGRSSSASRILGSVICGDDDDAASRDDFGSVASSMRENALMMGTGMGAGKGEGRMLGHGVIGSAAAALVDDAAFGALMTEAASRPFAAERAAEILNERLGRLLNGHGSSSREDEGVAELLSISLGKEVRRLKKKCLELDRRGREELAAERQRGQALAVVEMRRADLLKDAMMQEHEATKGARAALERQVRELQAMLRSQQQQQQDVGGVSDAALRGAFEELKRQVEEDRERRAAEDEEVEAYIQSLRDEVEEARQGERQAMELVDQLRHEVEDIKGGAADGGGKQGGDGGEEKRVLIDELECARLELDASEDARRELEGVVAAANQETDALRKRLADFEAELRRGEFAGSLNDRVAALEGETVRLATELEARQARIDQLEHETTRRQNFTSSAVGSPPPAGSPLSRMMMERAASAMMSHGDARHVTRRSSSSGNSVSSRRNVDTIREGGHASSLPKSSPNGIAGRTASTPIFRPNITSGPPRSVTPSPAGTPLPHAANQGQGGTLFERRSSLPRPRSSSFSGSPPPVRSPSSSLTSPTFSSSQKFVNLTRPASPPLRSPSSGAGPSLSRRPSSSQQDQGQEQQAHRRLPSSHGSWVARNHQEQVSRTASISSHGSNRSQVASLPSPEYRPSDSATSPGAHNISSTSPLPSSSPSPSVSRKSPGRRWISSGHSKTFSDMRSLNERKGGIRSPDRSESAMSPMLAISAGKKHLDSWPEDRGDTQSSDFGPPSPGTDTSLDQIMKPQRRPDPIHISASTTPPRTPSASGGGSPAVAPILQGTRGDASYSSQREEGNNSGSYGELRQEIAWLKDQLSSSKGASSKLSNSSGKLMLSSDGKRRGPRTSLSISARIAGAGGGKSIADQMRERKRSLGLA